MKTRNLLHFNLLLATVGICSAISITNVTGQYDAMILHVFPAIDGATVIRVPMTKKVDFRDKPARQSDIAVGGTLDFQYQQDIEYAYFTGGPAGSDRSVCLFASYPLEDSFPLNVYDHERLISDQAANRASPMFEEGNIMGFQKAFSVFCGAFYGLRG